MPGNQLWGLVGIMELLHYRSPQKGHDAARLFAKTADYQHCVVDTVLTVSFRAF